MDIQPVGREFRSLAMGAIIGGAISFGFQLLADTNHRAAELRDARRVAATNLFQEVGRLMDARFYFLANRPTDPARSLQWHASLDSLNDLWHERIPTNSAIMCHYFGDSYASDLVTISSQFSDMENATSDNFSRLAETTRHSIYLLELKLADQLRQGDILEGSPSVGGCDELELKTGKAPQRPAGSLGP